ncbi:MAG TPA: HdeD family acid-resistance protein [Anaeromyxobacteraceae bacterium]|nr:HdeD family acid-resistance protein [Anaeromyxobacteraceae bacterium]
MAIAEARAALAKELGRSWGWVLAWGILLIAAGVIGLGYEFAVSVVTAYFVGGLMVAYGVMEIVHAFRIRRWGGSLLFILGGALSVVAGVLIWTRPLAGLAVLTLMAAAWFLVLGAFRVVGAVSSRHPGWGWGLVNGAVSMLLGILVWRGWPASSLWVIGLFVCIDMIFQGWNYVMLALVVRQAARQVAPGEH